MQNNINIYINDTLIENDYYFDYLKLIRKRYHPPKNETKMYIKVKISSLQSK